MGLLGAALGVAALLADLPVLGVAAGAAALAAGIVAMLARPAVTGPTTDDRELESTRAELEQARRRVAELESSRTDPAPTPVPTPADAVATSEAPAADQDVALLTDPTSKLFSEAYFRVALGSRLASARRHLRPVAVALVQVAEGQATDSGGDAPPARVAEAVKETLRESDIACRLDDGSYAVILEDTPENGAVWTVERIRRNLVSRFGSHTMWAGVACYPAHAFSTEELMEQARAALDAAQEWKQDRIEVAVAE